VFIGNPRDAVPVDLPIARLGAVRRQEVRLSLRCRMPVDDIVLGVRQRREYVEGHCDGG